METTAQEASNMNTSTNEQIRVALNVVKAIMFSDEMVEAVPATHTEDEIRTAGMAIRTAAGVLSDLQHLLETTGTLEGAAAQMGQARLFDRTAEVRGADVAEMLFGPRA
jgi:hypothetical protein